MITPQYIPYHTPFILPQADTYRVNQFLPSEQEGIYTHTTGLTTSDVYPPSHKCLCYCLSFIYQTQLKHELHASPDAGLQGGGN